MDRLSEEPISETPILDGLLSTFKWPGHEIKMAMEHIHTQKIKERLGRKAKSGLLTKDDIEEGLSELTQYSGAEVFQKEILEHLALNYREVFTQLIKK